MWVRNIRGVLAAAVAMTVLLAACGDDGTTDPATPTEPTEPAGSILDVPAALGHPDSREVRVEGFVFGQHANTDAYRLCELQLESFPPQCGGAELFIIDEEAMLAQLEDDAVELAREGSVSWSEQPVVLRGHRRGPDGLEPILPDPAPLRPGGDNPHSGGDPSSPIETELEVVQPLGLDVADAPVDPAAILQHPIVPHRAVAVDERTIELHLWGGVEPCFVLHSVIVDEGDSLVVVEMIGGTPPAAVDEVCEEVAVERAHRIVLEAPLGDRVLLARS